MTTRMEKIKDRSHLHLFCVLSSQIQDNEQKALKAVELHSYNFSYASERLRDKKDFCMFGIKRSFHNFKHISSRLKKDYDLIDYYLSHNRYGYKELDIDFYSRDYKVLSIILSKSLSLFGNHSYHFLKEIFNIYENKLPYLYIFDNIIRKKEPIFKLKTYEKEEFFKHMEFTKYMLFYIDKYDIPPELFFIIVEFLEFDSSWILFR